MIKRLCTPAKAGVILFSFILCVRYAEADQGYLLASQGYKVGYKAYVHLDRYEYLPGETIEGSIRLRLQGRLPEKCTKDVEQWYVIIVAERHYDAEGRLRQDTNVFCSTTLTPTGMAIEHYSPTPYLAFASAPITNSKSVLGGMYRSPVEIAVAIPDRTVPLLMRGKERKVSFSARIPDDIPHGHYRFFFDVVVRWKGKIVRLEQLVHMCEHFDENYADSERTPEALTQYLARGLFSESYLPYVKIGSPAHPRMIWTLFGDQEGNGTKGLVADEDAEYFQFSLRRKVPAQLILPPGSYRIEPDFPEYAIGKIATDLGAAFLMPSLRRSYLTYPSGSLSVSVTDPHGVVYTCGPRPFSAPTETGATTGDPGFVVPFTSFGTYTISMSGWIEDTVGHRFFGGGTYQVIIARPLTFSTSVKPGTPFFVGEAYPVDLSINPPVPADVAIKVLHYRYSRKDDCAQFQYKGKANPYGYFDMEPDKTPFVFDAPGEYRSETTATYWAPDGTLWAGIEDSASVVAPLETPLVVHGHKIAQMKSYEHEGFFSRGVVLQEGSSSITFRDFANCFRLPLPYYSGDVAYLASTMDGGNSFTSILSHEWRDDRIRQAALKDLSSVLEPSAEAVKGLTLNMRADYPMVDLDRESSMLPFVFLSRDGLSPFSFPESTRRQAYFYLSAIRPGLVPQFTVSDSTMFQPYWETSPDRFGGQINVCRNGDLPRDMYRFLGGAVIQDLETNTSWYGVYSSVGIVIAPGSYANRISGPCQEPLMELNGKDYYLCVALEPAQIQETGGSFALAGTVLPTVPAICEFSVTKPDGTCEHVRGQANQIGRCYLGRVRCERPGIYRVKARAEYQGKSGDVLGSGDGGYNNYVVDSDRTPLFTCTSVNGVRHIDANRDLVLSFEVADAVRIATVAYTVLMPGIIMDEGQIEVKGRTFHYAFSPTAAARQFSLYDIVDYVEQKPKLADTVVMVFFLSGTDSAGKPVYDAKKIVLRGQTLYEF